MAPDCARRCDRPLFIAVCGLGKMRVEVADVRGDQVETLWSSTGPVLLCWGLSTPTDVDTPVRRLRLGGGGS